MNRSIQTKKSYLNVGCGQRFHKGEPWINLDVAPCDTSVLPWDARAGLPLGTNSCEVVYLSHVLEHFSKKSGASLMAECRRVLKPGGILRVIVPDLERICREYLRQLDAIRTFPPGHPDRLSWIKLELLDQCTRHESGGSMRTFFNDHGLNEVDYVVGRIGTVGSRLADACRHTAKAEMTGTPRRPHPIKKRRASLRTLILKSLLKKEEAEALRIGQFRMRGEVHLWMYDAITLEQLLGDTGLSPVSFHSADTSQIPNWACYHLDRDLNGLEHAPSSLYAEGIKLQP